MSDSFEITVKAASDAGPGSWTAIASSTNVDRENEVVETGTLTFRDKLPVHYPHFGDLVGSGRPTLRGGLLHFDGVFARTPKAQEVRQLVKDGHLHAMSVYMLGGKKEIKNGRYHIVGAELVAVDFVNIGANREALVSTVRTLGDPTVDYAVARARAELVLAQAALVLGDDPVLERAKSALARYESRYSGEAQAFLRELGGGR